MNEFIFLAYILVISSSLLYALYLSKTALTTLICILAILVNLFVSKEIILCGFTATSSDALAVGITLGLNLLQEYFGKQSALEAIRLSFLGALFYVLISMFHLAYLPAPTDISSAHFNALLSQSARVVLASLIVYLLVQTFETQLYAYFQKVFNNKHFIIRNYSSTAFTQFLDTVLFSFLGLWKLNSSFSSLKSIGQIIAVSYAIKLIVILCSAPFLALSKKIRLS